MPLSQSIARGSFPALSKNAPLQGRNSFVKIYKLPIGITAEPIQDDSIGALGGGHHAHVTIDAAVDAEDYTLFFNGATSITYTAAAGDTVKAIAEGLIAAVEANTGLGVTCTGDRGRNSDADWQFWLVSASSFTVANTGSSTPGNVDVSAVTDSSAVTAGVGDTTVRVCALQADIAKDTYLTFYDAQFNTKRLAFVTATATAVIGSDYQDLTVEALDEAIPLGTMASSSPEAYDLTAADISQTFQSAEILTFSTGGATDSVESGDTTNLALPGNIHHKDSAKLSAELAADSGQNIYVWVYDPVPEEGFTPYHQKGRCGVTSIERAHPASGFVTGNLQARFKGRPEKVRAKKNS